MIKNYYLLTKPGIIYGNAITFAGGFFLASQGSVDYMLFVAALLGLSCIIASSCVLNNYIDRDIDAKMARTKNRALVSHAISVRAAIIFAAVLGMLGFLVLYFFTDLLTLAIALLGMFFYVVVYSLWTKRQSVYGTLVGSISGAVPPVAGYVAVTNALDLGALLLFVILTLWQMPHFYAIAIYRLQDYVKAGIPVLPAKEGIPRTKIHMLIYVHFFLAATVLLTLFGYTGYVYLTIMSVLGIAWLVLALKGFGVQAVEEHKWARQMFIFSIIIITCFSGLIALGYVNS